MSYHKEITKDNELLLYFKGKLIYKKSLDKGYSKIFDKLAYGKYTECSITDFDRDDSPEFITITAKIYLYPTNQGGRKTSINSGYRPDHVFEYQNKHQFKYAFMGDIHFNKCQNLSPGETTEAAVRFLSHQPIEEHLTVGRKWFLHEGPVKVGEGEIINIS